MMSFPEVQKPLGLEFYSSQIRTPALNPEIVFMAKVQMALLSQGSSGPGG